MADGNTVLSQPVFDLNAADTSLEHPDMSEARDERFNRNRTAMMVSYGIALIIAIFCVCNFK